MRNIKDVQQMVREKKIPDLLYRLLFDTKWNRTSIESSWTRIFQTLHNRTFFKESKKQVDAHYESFDVEFIASHLRLAYGEDIDSPEISNELIEKCLNILSKYTDPTNVSYERRDGSNNISFDVKNTARSFLHNYYKLDEKDLLYLLNEFNSTFRGRIEEIYIIKDYVVFETISEKNEHCFWAHDKRQLKYGLNNGVQFPSCSEVYPDLDSCLAALICYPFKNAVYELCKSRHNDFKQMVIDKLKDKEE